MGNEEQTIRLSGVFTAEPAVVEGGDDRFAGAGGGNDEVAIVLTDGPLGSQLVEDPALISIGRDGERIGSRGLGNLFMIAFAPDGSFEVFVLGKGVGFELRGMPVGLEGSHDFMHGGRRVVSGDLHVPFQTAGDGGVGKIRGTDVGGMVFGIAVEDVGFGMQPGPFGVVGHADFDIGQCSDGVDGLDIGSTHIGGSDETQPAATFSKGFQFLIDEPETAPFDEGNQHVDTVGGEDFLLELVEHGRFALGAGE